MAVIDIYLGSGVGTLDSVLDVDINYIDDKQINKATFKVYEELGVQSGDQIRFYDVDSILQFKGKCKEVNPLSDADTGMSELICYTYEIELTERTVTEVFLAQPLETFIETIVTTYSSLNFATTLATGITVDQYLADKKSAFDLVKDVIDRSPELTYYINYTTNTFHLIKKGDTQSPVSLIQGDNALFATGWKEITDKQCTVLNLIGGKETRSGYSQSFNGTGAQTTFTLGFAPSNMHVLVGGVSQSLQVSGMNTGDYTIISKDKQLIFEAGSIPASGTANIVVTYDYEIPIDLSGIEADPALIEKYGIIERTITRNHLKSVNDALDYGYEYVNQWAKPLYGNEAEIIRTLDASQVIPGNKIWVEDTDHLINGAPVVKFFLIKQVSYTLNGLKITVGDIRNTAMDFMKELRYGINQLESGNNNSSVISKSYFLTDNVTLTATEELVYQLEQTLPDDALYYFAQDEFGDADPSLINNGEERPYSSAIEGLVYWNKLDGNLMDYSGNGKTSTLHSDYPLDEAHWKLNGDGLDSSGNSNDLTLYGSETFVTGKLGQALSVHDGTDMAQINMTIPTLAFSVSLKFRQTSYSTGADYIIRSDCDQRTYLYGGTAFKFAKGTTYTEIGGSVPIVLNQWYDITLTWANGVAWWYVDGVLIGTGSFPQGTDGNYMNFGSFNKGTESPSQWVNGDIDDIRINYAVLDQSEVLAITNYGVGTEMEAPITYGTGNQFDKCLTFAGKGTPKKTQGTYVELDSTIYANSINHSLSFWYRTTSNYFQMLFIQFLNSSSGNIEFRPSDNTLHFESVTNNHINMIFTAGAVDIDDGEWHHYVYVFSPTSTKLYIDKVLRDTQSANTDPLGYFRYKYIGGYGATTYTYGEMPTGQMSDVRIYDEKQLSLNEVTRLHNSGFGIVDNAINEIGGVLQDNHYKFSDKDYFSDPDYEIAQTGSLQSWTNIE